MGDNTAIEWARHPVTGRGATWNPVRARNLQTGKVGWHCEHVTEACRHCYAEAQNANTRNLPHGGTGLAYKPGHLKDIEIFLDEEVLLQPLRWRAPRGIFAGSMTDLYGDFVPDAWLDRIKAVEALCPQHVFFELTKRSDRRLAYLAGDAEKRSARASVRLKALSGGAGRHAEHIQVDATEGWADWPLPNVWQGGTVHDQPSADEVVPILLATPAAVRFVSAEPLLGLIDFKGIPIPGLGKGGGPRKPLLGMTLDQAREIIAAAAEGRRCDFVPTMDALRGHEVHKKYFGLAKLDWIIVGGESGSKARPMHPSWARSIRDQCAAAGVPFFFKQWGEWEADALLYTEARTGLRPPPKMKIGKKRAGRLLDGREHNDLPAIERRAA